MSERSALDAIWWGDDALARAARVALLPLELAYRAGVAARGRLYDAGVLATRAPALPALSVGNLTVGGTGKTPVAAWLAARLRERGAAPAIVLRGYGADEPLVHRRLNPDIPVIAAADRLAGIARAADARADVVVLDDAFQHRRARRLVDIVLVSADRWSEHRRLLPAGPWREPLRAAQRASLVLITRKAASESAVAAARRAIECAAPRVPIGVVRLDLDELRAADESSVVPVTSLAGERVLVVAAVGDPDALAAQLRAVGARVRMPRFADHHRFTTPEAAALAETVAPGERVVCTLKDAVKLTPLWPRAAAPILYVSQRVHPEEGGDAVDAALARLVEARHRQP